MNAGDPLEWYHEIPIVSRVYLTASFLTTAACALDLVSPFSLYFVRLEFLKLPAILRQRAQAILRHSVNACVHACVYT